MILEWYSLRGGVGSCALLCSLVQGFLLYTPALCSLHRNASCWEVNTTKLVHRCTEALQKEEAKHCLDLHQAKHCL